MSKRVKPILNPTIITSLTEADQVLSKISTIQREISILESKLNADIDKVKVAYEEQAIPLRHKKEELEQSLLRYAENNRELLFTDTSKSKQLIFGSFGYRSSSSLCTINKTPWDTVLGLLKAKDMGQYIRYKAEVDKEQLRTAPESVLKSVRCVLREKESFFYEVNAEELKEKVA